MLVVEDEKRVAAAVRRGLESEGFAVDVALTGTDGLWYASENPYDVIVLDIMLPGINGYRVCEQLRDAGNWTPILMLTAKSGEYDQAEALDTGADDYLTKPFSFVVLLARVRALLRRAERREDAEEAPLVLGDVEIDRARHTARVRGEPVHLTAKEFALLIALVEANGRVLSRQALLESVWGYSYAEGTRTVDVHVRRLREKLPGLSERLITVKSLGYRITREGG